MIDLLEKLWLKGQLPIIQGIVKNNGYYFKLENDKNQIKIAEPAQFSFDFESNNFSDINPLFEIKYNQYTLYCGEGSWKVSDTSLITIWFIKKENRWLPIESYELEKGSEF